MKDNLDAEVVCEQQEEEQAMVSWPDAYLLHVRLFWSNL
jgi:hypothetical protein